MIVKSLRLEFVAWLGHLKSTFSIDEMFWSNLGDSDAWHVHDKWIIYFDLCLIH